jgi:NhaP-type Na+/H+ or K+/H+ antiporter
MEIVIIFLIAATIIGLGILGDYVFRRTNIPDVFWLIVFGIILALLFPEDIRSIDYIAPLFTTFALIFILFEGALNLNLNKLFKGMIKSSVLSIVNFVGTVLIVAVLFYAAHLGFLNGLLLGSIIGGTSSAVVVPLVQRLKISKLASTTLLLESALTDVLCIVFTLSLIEVFKIGNLNLYGIAGNIFYTFAISLILGIFFAFIWVLLLKIIMKHNKSYMITIAALLIVYAVAELINANGAIACLAFGVVLGNSDNIFKKTRLRNLSFNPEKISNGEKFFYNEISFVLKTFFFVYLGLMMNFNNIKLFILALLIVVLLFFLIRPFATMLIAGKLPRKDISMIESIVPKGLAAAVLARMPFMAGIPGTEFFADLVFAVILISILLSTILIYLIEKDKYSGIYLLFRKENPLKK